MSEYADVGAQQALEPMQNKRAREDVKEWMFRWGFSAPRVMRPPAFTFRSPETPCSPCTVLRLWSFCSVSPCLTLWAHSFLMTCSYFSMQSLSCLSSPWMPFRLVLLFLILSCLNPFDQWYFHFPSPCLSYSDIEMMCIWTYTYTFYISLHMQKSLSWFISRVRTFSPKYIFVRKQELTTA